MRLITQPNGWTCQPASYAMSMDLTLEQVLQVLGHDGSRIDNFNATSVVWTVACFARAELALAAYKLGYAAVEVPAAMVNHNGRPIPNYPKTPDALMRTFAPGTRFVLTVESENHPKAYHCVAYELGSSIYYDPLHKLPRDFCFIQPIILIAAILKLGVTDGPLPYYNPTTGGFPTSLD